MQLRDEQGASPGRPEGSVIGLDRIPGRRRRENGSTAQKRSACEVRKPASTMQENTVKSRAGRPGTVWKKLEESPGFLALTPFTDFHYDAARVSLPQQA